ncbi:MAG: tyrosine--tRNA ligase, partial [Candidatus Methanomethylophilaceae archaeon]
KGGNRMDPASCKMSKSDPDNGISIHDSEDEIRRKLKKAFCPMEAEGADNNPVLLLCRYLVFDRLGHLEVERPEKFGGPMRIESMEMLLDVYLSGKLHPSDLKSAVAEALIEILAPVRDYFQKKPENHARMQEILQKLGRC